MNQFKLDENMNTIMDVINLYIARCKEKSELILTPLDKNHPNNKSGVKLTQEQKEWLLDPRILNCFRENE